MSKKLNETTSYNVAGLTAELMNIRNEVILKLISGDEVLKLDCLNGKETIADSKNVFSSIDKDFKNYGANKTSTATKELIVEVYEMAKDTTFTQMFRSLNSDLGKLCLTQHQILNFVQKHRNWLRTEGYATLFLFKAGDQFFIALMRFDITGLLFVFVDFLECERVWNATIRYRIVAPQLPL